MRKFFSYMFAGALVSSMAVFACSSDSTSDDDADDDTTSSSSSSGDGGRTSSSGGSSSGGSSSSSSSSSGSSNGGTPADNLELTGLTIDPDTAVVGTEATHTFRLEFTGTPALDDQQRFVFLGGLSAVPDGVTQDQADGAVSELALDQQTEEGLVTGSFKFEAPAAGEYTVVFGFDDDADQATNGNTVTGATVTATADN